MIPHPEVGTEIVFENRVLRR